MKAGGQCQVFSPVTLYLVFTILKHIGLFEDKVLPSNPGRPGAGRASASRALGLKAFPSAPLPFAGKASPCTQNWQFWPGWLASEPFGSACLYAPALGTARATRFVFSMGAGDQNLVTHVHTAIIFPTGPSITSTSAGL